MSAEFEQSGYIPQEAEAQTWRMHMAYGSERFASVTANNHNIILFGDGDGVQKLVLGNDVALVLPSDPSLLPINAGYPTHQESWLPLWFVLLYHSQHRTAEELSYRQAVNARVTAEDRDLVCLALIHKANEFWQGYKADTSAKEPRKRYKQFTRILQDILLYIDMPETVIEDQQAYLEAHPLYPLIVQANRLRKGEELEKAGELEGKIEAVLTSYTDTIGKEAAKQAFDVLQTRLTEAEAGNKTMVIIMPDKTVADAQEVAELVRFDLVIAEDEHDQDVISIVSGLEEPSFHQIDTQFGPKLASRRRMDIIAVPETLDVWDVVRGGKESYQPIAMIVATHTTTRTEAGRQLQARLQRALGVEFVARHYVGAAEEFLHQEAWGKSFVRRIDNERVPQIKKAIPLYRVACDLLPRAIYMLKTGQFPARVPNEELWRVGETAQEAARIEKMFAHQDATQEQLLELFRTLEEKFSRWFKPEDYQLFRENMARIGSVLTEVRPEDAVTKPKILSDTLGAGIENTLLPTAAVAALMTGRIETEYQGYVDVKVHPQEPLTILNYTELCSRKSRWDEITRASRGLIVHRLTDEIVALPFPKFFNLGEIGEVMVESLPHEPFTVFEKIDGSLGVMYRDSAGRLCLATRGSFKSEQAIRGTEMLQKLPDIEGIPTNLTMLFEIVYPENRVVVNYGDKEELVLLAIMNRETGEELPWSAVELWANRLGTRLPVTYQFSSVQDLLDAKVNLPSSLEGFVIRFQSGLRVKLKGDAYLELHRVAMNINQRSVLKALSEGQYEEYLIKAPEEFRTMIEDMAAGIKNKALRYEFEVRQYFARAPRDGDRKSFALWVKGHVPRQFQSGLFQLLDDNRRPNWIDLASKIEEESVLG